MPCCDPRDDMDARHNNEAAQLLCALLNRLDSEKMLTHVLTDELRDGWKEHRDHDVEIYRERE